MKAKPGAESRANGTGYSFAGPWVSSCKAVISRVKQARDALLAEARETLQVEDRMLRLALNEAEALAWASRYPHLVFPDLAAEKIRGVAAWDRHQREVEEKARAAAS